MYEAFAGCKGGARGGMRGNRHPLRPLAKPKPECQFQRKNLYTKPGQPRAKRIRHITREAIKHRKATTHSHSAPAEYIAPRASVAMHKAFHIRHAPDISLRCAATQLPPLWEYYDIKKGRNGPLFICSISVLRKSFCRPTSAESKSPAPRSYCRYVSFRFPRQSSSRHPDTPDPDCTPCRP